MTKCPNCGSTTVENYCAHCGQRIHSAHGMREFMRGVVDDQFGVDAKLPRTLKALFLRPGALTSEYMNGRIARYIPPFRLYLLASVLFFVLLSFMSVRKDWGGEAGRELGAEAARLDSARTNADSTRPAADTVGSAANQRKDIRLGVSVGGERWMDNAEVDLPWPWLDRKVEENLRALGKLPPDVATRRVLTAVIAGLPKVVFLLLPVFALLLKLLYFLRRRPYLEHFVFALHLHAFMFVLFTIVLFFPSERVAAMVGTVIAIYSFIAMKRVYGQGYAMTVAKWSALVLAYVTLVAVGMVFSLIWAFAAVSPV